MLRGTASVLDQPGANWLYAIGRVTGPTRASEISARVTTALQHWLAAQPFFSERERSRIPQAHIVVTPAGRGTGSTRAQYERPLNLLFAAAAMVLLIGTANLANLLLARADRGQAAIRAPLGAPTSRLIVSAMLAAALPARRAASVNPATALRGE